MPATGLKIVGTGGNKGLKKQDILKILGWEDI